jgi:hypothetical protein
MNSIKQNKNETVNSFHTRLELLQTRTINSISLKHNSNVEHNLSGRLAMVKDIALQRFILHSNNEISMALRRTKPRNRKICLKHCLKLYWKNNIYKLDTIQTRDIQKSVISVISLVTSQVNVAVD